MAILREGRWSYVQPESTNCRAPFGGCLSQGTIKASRASFGCSACSTASTYAPIFPSYGTYCIMYYLRPPGKFNGSALSQSGGSGGYFQSSVAGDTQRTSCTRAPK